jgi:hypothetical protein
MSAERIWGLLTLICNVKHKYGYEELLSWGIWRHVVHWQTTEVSEENVASILRFAYYLLQPGILLGLFFDTEDRGNMFLRKIC